MSNAHSRLRLFRVSPLGAGLIGAAVTLIFAMIGGVFFLFFAAIGLAGSGSSELGAGIAGVIGALVGILIIYPIMGFIGGFLYAVMFNLIAPMIGGLELRVSGIRDESEEIWKDV